MLNSRFTGLQPAPEGYLRFEASFKSQIMNKLTRSWWTGRAVRTLRAANFTVAGGPFSSEIPDFRQAPLKLLISLGSGMSGQANEPDKN